jgi:immunity protein, SdpI family
MEIFSRFNQDFIDPLNRLIHSTFFNADLIIGAILLIMGIFIRVWPPAKINSFWGYSSYMSRVNQDTWNSANRYAADLSRLLSYILIAIGIVTGLFFESQSDPYYYVTVGTTIIIVMMFRGMTERFLYKQFNEDGSRKKTAE